MIKLKKFDLEEIVSEPVFRKYGQTAWQFFDPRLLVVMDWLREQLDKPITINNWVWGGNFDQRGLRENTCPIVFDRTMNDQIYLSAHVLGMAFDFDVEGMAAKEVRDWLIMHQDEIPYHIRLEDGVTWVHLDCMNISEEKVYLFKA